MLLTKGIIIFVGLFFKDTFIMQINVTRWDVNDFGQKQCKKLRNHGRVSNALNLLR